MNRRRDRMFASKVVDFQTVNQRRDRIFASKMVDFQERNEQGFAQETGIEIAHRKMQVVVFEMGFVTHSRHF